MRKQVKMSVLKRILAVVIAVAVAVSMLTIPDAEVSAATGKVKSVAVTNLPAKQLTLKKGKSFTLKTKVSVSSVKGLSLMSMIYQHLNSPLSYSVSPL